MEFIAVGIREVFEKCATTRFKIFDSLPKTCTKTNYNILTSFINELSNSTSVTEYCFLVCVLQQLTMIYRQTDLQGRVGMDPNACGSGWGWIQTVW